MSLIQDALKRQQEEMNKKESAAPPPLVVPPVKPLDKLETPTVQPPASIESKISLRMMGQSLSAPKQPFSPPVASPEPAVPPPLSTPASSSPTTPTSGSMPRIALHRDAPKVESEPVKSVEPERSRDETKSEIEPDKRSKQIVLAVALILLLALGIGVYFGWSLVAGLLTSSSAVPPIATTGRPLTPVPESSAHITPSPTVEAMPAATGTVVMSNPFIPAASNLSPTAAASNAVPLPVAVITSRPPPPIAAPTVKPAVTPPVEPEINSAFQLEPKLTAPPISWPPVKLTGLVKLGKTSAALINGKVVTAGESIENVVLVKVTPEGALVRFQGEERVLRVGETAR